MGTTTITIMIIMIMMTIMIIMIMIIIIIIIIIRRNSLIPGGLVVLPAADRSSPPRLSATHSLCLVTGIFLTLVGLICFTVLPHLEELIRGIVLAYTALIPGGPMFSAWLTPPIVPHLSVYVFNITNPEEVGHLLLDDDDDDDDHT